MAEITFKYLMDQFAAFDMKYTEEQFTVITEYEYINSLLLATRLFDNALFCSINPYSYQIHANSTPLYKTSREAKEQGKPAFASTDNRVNSQVVDGIKASIKNQDIEENKLSQNVTITRVIPVGTDKALAITKLQDIYTHDGVRLVNSKINDIDKDSDSLYVGIRKDIQSEDGQMQLSQSVVNESTYDNKALFLGIIKKTWLINGMFLEQELVNEVDVDPGSCIGTCRFNSLDDVSVYNPQALYKREHDSTHDTRYDLSKITPGVYLNNDASLTKEDYEVLKGELNNLHKDENIKANVIQVLPATVHEKLIQRNENMTRINNIINSIFINCYGDNIDKSKYINEVAVTDGKQLDAGVKFLYSNSNEFAEKYYDKDSKGLGIYDTHVNIGSSNQSANIGEQTIDVGSIFQEGNSHSMGDFITKYIKDPKNSGDAINYISLSKAVNKEMFTKDLLAILMKDAMNMSRPHENVTVFSKEPHNTRVNHSESIISKGAHDTTDIKNYVTLYKKMFWNAEDKHILINDIISAFKKEYDTEINRKDIDIAKVEHMLSDIIDNIDIHKSEFDLQDPHEDISVDKGMFKISPTDDISLSKALRVLSDRDDFTSICKNYIKFKEFIPNIEIEAALKDTISEGELMVDRRGSEMVLDYDIAVQKYYISTNMKEMDGTFFDKRENLIALSQEILIDSTVKNTDVIGYIVSISNVYNNINITEDTVVDAAIKSIINDENSIVVDGAFKTVNIHEGSLNVDDIVRTIGINEQEEVDAITKDSAIHDNSGVNFGIVMEARISEDSEYVKNEKDTTIENTNIEVDPPVKEGYINNNIPHLELIKIVHDYNGMISIDKAKHNTMGDKDRIYYLVDKNTFDTNQELAKYIEMQKLVKDLYYDRVDDWVYDATEHDDLDLTAEGIDELLLPQVDFDYEKFKTDLVDPVTLKPINPVRQLPDGSFIATRPANHPLPEFKDIAKQYIDVDVSLLRYMIHIFNKTWQANMFKFGAMDMRDSVGKMLEFMDAYITLNIPTPLIPQSQRILRLMRWYGEASILKHAEYKIKYTYDSLSSDFYTGTCQIPNTMENMMIDTTKYTLRNTVLGDDAWIEFEIDNPVPTKITFIAYLTDGELSVFINDVLQDTVSVPMYNGEYDIVKLHVGEKNKVKLFYHSMNNGIINIAKVVISDMSYSDIVTEYSPKIGSGNKVLDDFVKRIAVYADMYKNNANFMEDTINGNLAITDLVDKLQTYFELHHDRKKKGKRKVIKR